MAARDSEVPVDDQGGAAMTTAPAGPRPSTAVPVDGPVGDEVTVPPATARRARMGVGFWVALAWLAAVLLGALFADLLPLQDPSESDFAAVSAGPSADHLFGTDGLGRDLLSRAVYGARVSLAVGLFAVVLGMAIGGALGLVAGYVRGRTESVITSLADTMLAFPALVLLLGITAVLGQSLRNLIIGLAIVSIPAFIRLTRANTLKFASEEFVLAARTTGARPGRIIVREVLPNVVPPMGAYAFVIIAVVIVAEGSLSFLGLGVPPPTPSWGAMIADGRQVLASAPHVVFVPSLVMFVTVYSFNLLGDRLRELFDVREGTL